MEVDAGAGLSRTTEPTSVLSELSCSLFDFIQVAMSSAHSVTDLQWKCIHSSRRTRAVYLRIIGVEMRWQTMAFNQRDQLHGVQDERTELVPAQNPEAHRRWGKRWLIAQTRGVLMPASQICEVIRYAAAPILRRFEFCVASLVQFRQNVISSFLDGSEYLPIFFESRSAFVPSEKNADVIAGHWDHGA